MSVEKTAASDRAMFPYMKLAASAMPAPVSVVKGARPNPTYPSHVALPKLTHAKVIPGVKITTAQGVKLPGPTAALSPNAITGGAAGAKAYLSGLNKTQKLAIGIGLAAAAAAGVSGTGLTMKNRSDAGFGGELPEEVPGASLSDIAVGTGAGATVGGLAGPLYGKFFGKPDLQRDVILALIGAAGGAAYQLSKSGSHQKEAEPITIGLLLASLVLSGAGLYQNQQAVNAQGRLAAEQNQLARDLTNAQLQESARSRKAITHGTVGALGGAAAGGGISNLFGKLNKRESLRRDILSTLAGAGVGGALGLMTAK